MGHVDDHSIINYNVVTAILYLEKDPNIVGGNISIIFDDFVFEVKTGSIIMMLGNVKHALQPMSETGIRSSMVFQFKRED